MCVCVWPQARLGRKSVELERKAVKLRDELEGKTPDSIRLREEIKHCEKRKMLSEKNLEVLVEKQAKNEEVMAKLEAELEEVEKEMSDLEAEGDAAGDSGEVRSSRAPCEFELRGPRRTRG